MQNIRKWLQLRREVLRKSHWLGWVLFVIDLILLGVGYAVSVNSGLVLGVVGIFLNHLLSPIIVQRIFIKELNAELRMSGALETKVIRKQDNDMQT